MLKFKDKVLTQQDTPLFSGLLSTAIDEAPQNLLLTFKGRKIPKVVWDKVKAFLHWTQLEYTGESQLRLFYNRELGLWDAHPFEQYISHSLSTNEVTDSEMTKKVLDSFISRGYENTGTVHHHCTAGAFQSLTDYNDEIKQNGLHITLGHMTLPTFDFHSRATLRGVMYAVNLADWFEEDVDLVTNIGIDAMPVEWKNYLSKRVVTSYTPYSGYNGYHGGYRGRDWEEDDYYGIKWWEKNQEKNKKTKKVNSAKYLPKTVSVGSALEQEKKLKRAIGETSAEEYMDTADAKDIITMNEYLDDLTDKLYYLQAQDSGEYAIDIIRAIQVLYNILNSCFRNKRKDMLEELNETMNLMEEIASSDVDLTEYFNYAAQEVVMQEELLNSAAEELDRQADIEREETLEIEATSLDIKEDPKLPLELEPGEFDPIIPNIDQPI